MLNITCLFYTHGTVNNEKYLSISINLFYKGIFCLDVSVGLFIHIKC